MNVNNNGTHTSNRYQWVGYCEWNKKKIRLQSTLKLLHVASNVNCVWASERVSVMLWCFCIGKALTQPNNNGKMAKCSCIAFNPFNIKYGRAKLDVCECERERERVCDSNMQSCKLIPFHESDDDMQPHTHYVQYFTAYALAQLSLSFSLFRLNSVPSQNIPHLMSTGAVCSFYK